MTLSRLDQNNYFNLGLGTNGVDTSAMELPGYLNRFNYDGADSKQSGKSWSGSDGTYP